MSQLNLFAHAPGRELPAGAACVRGVAPGEAPPVEDCARCGVPSVLVARAWNVTRTEIVDLCVACTRREVAAREAAGLHTPPGLGWARGARGR